MDSFQAFVEGDLHRWFADNKSVDGKPGWVRVDTGEACARKPGETATPKCVSQKKRASMSKKERESALRRKRYHDPDQASKKNAAEPTRVPTDKNESRVLGESGGSDRKGKNSGKKDACYHKVKKRVDVWPSAFASGLLVQCRKAGAENWGEGKNEWNFAEMDQLVSIGGRCSNTLIR